MILSGTRARQEAAFKSTENRFSATLGVRAMTHSVPIILAGTVKSNGGEDTSESSAIFFHCHNPHRVTSFSSRTS